MNSVNADSYICVICYVHAQMMNYITAQLNHAHPSAIKNLRQHCLWSIFGQSLDTTFPLPLMPILREGKPTW